MRSTGTRSERFAATFVLMTSVANMLGRFVWASASDRIGRQRTYTIFFVAGTLLYLTIPWTAQQQSASPSVTWLAAFYAVAMLIFSGVGLLLTYAIQRLQHVLPLNPDKLGAVAESINRPHFAPTFLSFLLSDQ